MLRYYDAQLTNMKLFSTIFLIYTLSISDNSYSVTDNKLYNDLHFNIHAQKAEKKNNKPTNQQKSTKDTVYKTSSSIDCSDDGQYPASQIICTDKELALFSLRLDNFYEALITYHPANKNSLYAKRNNFINNLLANSELPAPMGCSNKQCISRIYQQKLDELEKKIWQIPLDQHKGFTNIDTDKNGKITWVRIKSTKAKKNNLHPLNTREYTEQHFAARKFNSIIYTQMPSEIEPSNYAISNKIFDISFVRYSKEFAHNYGYPTTAEYIADMDKGVHAIAMKMQTKGMQVDCTIQILVDKGLGLDVPDTNYIRAPHMRMPPNKKRKGIKINNVTANDLTHKPVYWKYHNTVSRVHLAYNSHPYKDRKEKGAVFSTSFRSYQQDYFMGLDYIEIGVPCGKYHAEKYDGVMKNYKTNNLSIWFPKKDIDGEFKKFWSYYVDERGNRDRKDLTIKQLRQRSNLEFMHINIPKSLTDQYYKYARQKEGEASFLYKKTKHIKFISNQEDFNLNHID